MASASLLFFFITFFSLSCSALAFVFQPNFLSNALETISYSGYLSISLTLRITSKSLNLESKPLTIFAPSDPAFVKSGQLSIHDLQFHIAPLILSQYTLKKLPFGSKIPTLLSNQSLVVTTKDDQLSINGVLVQESPLIYDDFVAVYGMDRFFNSSFQLGTALNSVSKPIPAKEEYNASHLEVSGYDIGIMGNASNWLRSRGYSVMANFLDVQLAELNKDETRLTVFAPVDEAVQDYVKNVGESMSMFQRHVVPGLLTWKDLVEIQEGSSLPTFSGGYEIKVTWSGDILLFNDVPVVFPDMYSTESLVLHGLNSLLVSPVQQDVFGQSLSELDGGDYQNPLPYDYELP